jgi:hypothetical protein
MPLPGVSRLKSPEPSAGGDGMPSRPAQFRRFGEPKPLAGAGRGTNPLRGVQSPHLRQPIAAPAVEAAIPPTSSQRARAFVEEALAPFKALSGVRDEPNPQEADRGSMFKAD